MTTAVHPDEILKAILERGNRRDKAEKLRKLHEICSSEYARHSQGARNFSVANIARLAEKAGLFKARTIYTKQSKDYESLIKAWHEFNGPKESALAEQKIVRQSTRYEFLKKIEDPAVRSVCQMAVVERDKLRAELNMLKGKTTVIVDMRPLAGEITPKASDVAVGQMGAQLTDSERNALVAAIDPKALAQRRWRLGDVGEVFDERDRFVFLPGFATAITKILRGNGGS